jgi:hypothetical protein
VNSRQHIACTEIFLNFHQGSGNLFSLGYKLLPPFFYVVQTCMVSCFLIHLAVLSDNNKGIEYWSWSGNGGIMLTSASVVVP